MVLEKMGEAERVEVSGLEGKLSKLNGIYGPRFEPEDVTREGVELETRCPAQW